eukprot:TRINITY_DN68328_c0_g1_i1.p1 TRINITY_DN68328_c0_g1~~TRINITY_DN68328_c0_g1_i1.p1  ORF type:complete len:472 (-),score=72.05 TRINITY_DN68328_c0_g1_i1:120-1352(-)
MLQSLLDYLKKELTDRPIMRTQVPQGLIPADMTGPQLRRKLRNDYVVLHCDWDKRVAFLPKGSTKTVNELFPKDAARITKELLELQQWGNLKFMPARLETQSLTTLEQLGTNRITTVKKEGKKTLAGLVKEFVKTNEAGCGLIINQAAEKVDDLLQEVKNLRAELKDGAPSLHSFTIENVPALLVTKTKLATKNEKVLYQPTSSDPLPYTGILSFAVSPHQQLKVARPEKAQKDNKLRKLLCQLGAAFHFNVVCGAGNTLLINKTGKPMSGKTWPEIFVNFTGEPGTSRPEGKKNAYIKQMERCVEELANCDKKKTTLKPAETARMLELRATIEAELQKFTSPAPKKVQVTVGGTKTDTKKGAKGKAAQQDLKRNKKGLELRLKKKGVKPDKKKKPKKKAEKKKKAVKAL